MQTFTLKVTGEQLTAKELETAIWATFPELSRDEVIVEEIV